MKLYYYILIILMSLPVTSAASQAQSQCFSFEFEECVLPEALNRISTETGVGISVPLAAIKDRKISRSYCNSKIETIISDIFQGNNYSIVWNYTNDQLVQVEIQLPDSMDSEQIYKASPENAPLQKINRTAGENQSGGKTRTDHAQNTSGASHSADHGNNDMGYGGPIPPDPEKFKGMELPPLPPGISSVADLPVNGRR